MLHFFFIHSNITFLTSIGIIDKFKIQQSDVVFFSSNYKLPKTNKEYTVIDSLGGSHLNRLFNNFPKTVDSFIRKNFGENKFICYIDLMSYTQRIFVTNKNCEKFHFIEEGTSALSGNISLDHFTVTFKSFSYRLNSVFNIKNILFLLSKAFKGYSLRLISLPFQPSNYYSHSNTLFFCFSLDSFKLAPNKKKILLNFSDISNNFYDELNDLSNSTLFVGDNFVNCYGGVENEYECIINVLEKIKIKKNKIFYLPRKNGLIRDVEKKAFDYLNLEFEILDRKVPFEVILVKSKNCTVIGCTSALLFYSSLMGHKTHSYFFYLENRPYSVYEEMNSFWNQIHNI
jgi:hypothetical protein